MPDSVPNNRVFEIAWKTIQVSEGGASISDDPRDPGGLTRWGISQAAYPDLDIASLTEERARAIFRRDYWDRCRCGELPQAVAIALADAAFNHGVTGAVRMLQRALRVSPDGIMGPATVGAAARAIPNSLVNEMLSHRCVAYSAGNQAFRRGWFLRVLRLKDALAAL